MATPHSVSLWSTRLAGPTVASSGLHECTSAARAPWSSPTGIAAVSESTAGVSVGIAGFGGRHARCREDELPCSHDRPGHTLRQAARLMAARKVGAAVVHDADSQGYGILAERDILCSIAAEQDPDIEIAGDHLTRDVVFADPGWSLDDAAAAMLRGGFRHLIVTSGGGVAGILSMRDVVRCRSNQHVTVQCQRDVRQGCSQCAVRSRPEFSGGCGTSAGATALRSPHARQ